MIAPFRPLAAALLLGCATPAFAQAAPDAPAGYTMPGTAVWDMAADSGEVYRIFVSFPAGDPPEDGYPVLYVLDANAMFAGFAETRRILEYGGDGKMIVVGIGYPGDDPYDVRRLYDFTAAPTTSAAYARFTDMRSGGQDAFLDFLTGKLRTDIGARYPIDLRRQSLFGHSLGGLFVVHTLYERPNAFHALIAASPTLFWYEQAMLADERAFGERLRSGAISNPSRLMVVAGEREDAILELWDPESFARRMEPLSAYGLRTRWEVYDDETHITVPSRAVTDTFRFALTWP